MLSQTPMSPDAFYEAFLAMLSVHDFVAVESGGIIKIVPDANARQMPDIDLPDRISGRLRRARHPDRRRAERQRRAARAGAAAAHAPDGAHGRLSSRATSSSSRIAPANVIRVMRIIRRIDQQGDADVDIIPLQNASAAEVVRVVNTFFSAGRRGGGRRIPTLARDRGRPLEQRAHQRRADAAPAHQGAGRAPRYAARERRRHAGALPAVRGRREDRDETQGTDLGHGRHHHRCARGGRRRAVESGRELGPLDHDLGRTRRPTRWSSPRPRRSCGR